MLTKEEVLHVLNLARLEASEEEIEKYQVELKKMIDEIDKIKELDDLSKNSENIFGEMTRAGANIVKENVVRNMKELDDFDDELMIAPWSHDVTLRENDSLKIEDANVLENVPCKKGNFIAVDVEVLKDE